MKQYRIAGRPNCGSRIATRAGKSSSPRPSPAWMAQQRQSIGQSGFGNQSHVSIDRRFGFIRRWAATDAAAYEGRDAPDLNTPTTSGAEKPAPYKRGRLNGGQVIPLNKFRPIEALGAEASTTLRDQLVGNSRQLLHLTQSPSGHTGSLTLRPGAATRTSRFRRPRVGSRDTGPVGAA
jgi:hypothetical protein